MGEDDSGGYNRGYWRGGKRYTAEGYLREGYQGFNMGYWYGGYYYRDKTGRELYEGVEEEFYDNGKLKSRVHWREGVKDGLEEEWFSSGKLKGRCHWDMGDRHGIEERNEKDWTSEPEVIEWDRNVRVNRWSREEWDRIKLEEGIREGL